jgi:hypothetical protein
MSHERRQHHDSLPALEEPPEAHAARIDSKSDAQITGDAERILRVASGCISFAGCAGRGGKFAARGSSHCAIAPAATTILPQILPEPATMGMEPVPVWAVRASKVPKTNMETKRRAALGSRQELMPALPPASDAWPVHGEERADMARGRPQRLACASRTRRVPLRPSRFNVVDLVCAPACEPLPPLGTGMAAPRAGLVQSNSYARAGCTSLRAGASLWTQRAARPPLRRLIEFLLPDANDRHADRTIAGVKNQPGAASAKRAKRDTIACSSPLSVAKGGRRRQCAHTRRAGA